MFRVAEFIGMAFAPLAAVAEGFELVLLIVEISGQPVVVHVLQEPLLNFS